MGVTAVNRVKSLALKSKFKSKKPFRLQTLIESESK